MNDFACNKEWKAFLRLVSTKRLLKLYDINRTHTLNTFRYCRKENEQKYLTVHSEKMKLKKKIL